jgi:hypothetical protein
MFTLVRSELHNKKDNPPTDDDSAARMSLDSGLPNPVTGFDPSRTEEENGESGQQETRQPARKKRVLTAARKEQNRLAQRAFRKSSSLARGIFHIDSHP